MILKSDEIARRLRSSSCEEDVRDPFVITPPPDLDSLLADGAASIDLRLGSWFLTFRQTSVLSFN
jgi:hypothetical protein